MLILLDMDGTILTTNPNAVTPSHKLRIISSVIKEVFGIDHARYEKVLAGEFAGLTDVLIMRRMLVRLGVDEAAVQKRLQFLIDTLCTQVQELIDRGEKSDYYMMIPGAAEAIERFLTKGHHVAICTGNLECLARMKMSFIGMDTSGLGPGAFGTDADERWKIIGRAIERNPGFDKENIVYIGDTPRDIIAADKAGVSCIAMCHTGEFTPEDLSGASRVVTSWQQVEI